VFRAYTFGTGASIADGGRYNSLIQQFGKDAPSVGFAIIIDGLMTALERQGIKLPIEEIHTLLLYNPSSRKFAIGISESMRAQEMNIEVGLLQKTIEENIDYGKKRNIGGIMNFISEDEVQLINLTTDERQLIPVSELFEEDDHVHYHGTDDGEGEIL
jgi:ATP phosphoribosyltransferase regulatory subunit